MIGDIAPPYARPILQPFNPNQTSHDSYHNQFINPQLLEKIAPFQRSFTSPSILLDPEEIINIAKHSDSILFERASFKQELNPIDAFNSFYGKENISVPTLDQKHFVEYMKNLGWKYHRWIGKQLLLSMVEI